MGTLLDPYARPSDELSETEKRILAAAFAAQSLSIDSLARGVPIALGRPVLLSDNTKSDVLVVSIQVVSVPGVVRGLLGRGPTLFAGSALRVSMLHSDEPLQQILLASEQLWFVPDTIVGSSSLVVSEVTP